VFFGWWVVAGAIVVNLITLAAFVHAYGMYVVVLRDEFAWNATLLSFGFALVRIENGLLGPLQGWLVDRYGPRTAVSLGAITLAAGLLWFSRLSDVGSYLGAVALMAVGSSLTGIASLNVAVVHWFERRRALALYLSTMGTFGAPLLVPLVVLGFTQVGWRATAAISAAVVLAVALPAAQLLRHRPEMYGLRPDGGAAPEDGAALTPVRAMPPISARQALRVRQFYYLSLGHGCAVLMVNAVLVHMVLHLTSTLGYSLAETSGFVVLLSLFTLAGTVCGGFIGDRIERRDIVVACMLGHFVGIVVLSVASAAWMVFAFLALHGISWGLRGPLMSSLRADYFGTASFGMITGLSAMIVTVGAFMGPLLGGLIYDATGSYAPAFMAIASFALIGAVFFILAARADRSSRVATAVA